MKRSEHLEPLSHDHYEGLLVAGRIREGLHKEASTDVMAAYVTHFWQSHLARHFIQEEKLLLPLLETLAVTDLTDRMIREHRIIRDLVAPAEKGTTWSAERLAELSRAMKAHIRFEERELFPALEAQASEETLHEIGIQLQEAHTEADLSWTPAFWE